MGDGDRGDRGQLIICRAFFNCSFSELFFNISRTNSKTSKVNHNSLYQIFKYFMIFLKNWI